MNNRIGFYSSILLVFFTLITFGFAIIAIPISGANAQEGGVPYPYLDTFRQYPKDFMWMYLAIFLILIYLVVVVSIHTRDNNERSMMSMVGLCFAVMAVLILLVDYYIQLNVVPVSLQQNETEGIALLIQYNPHGIFIALEEIGYIMMTLSYIFIALSFHQKTRLEGAIRLTFITPFPISMIFLVLYSVQYGLNRQDRFEIVILSFAWIALIINGILLSKYFHKRMKE